MFTLLKLGQNVPKGQVLALFRKLAHIFNGYEYGGSFEGCAEIENKARLAIEENKTEDLTLSELRTCLFFHYRAVHYAGGPPNELRVNMLLELIRDRVSKNEME